MDMYSGLAEAYGLYTALSFIQQYCQYYPELLQKPCTIHTYCDKASLIKHHAHHPAPTPMMLSVMTTPSLPN